MLAPPLRTARKPTRPRPALARNEFTTPAERAREAHWWATYAWIEERFYWVLPPDLQPLARRRYVQRIADFLHDAVHVIDYGCGNGWIARALARRVRARVTGLDFSPAQIALARATEVPAGARIDFQSLAGPQDLPVADAYLFHGVLHHLPAAEIHDLMNQVQRLAPRGARLVFVEPACFTGQPVGDAQRALLDRIQVQVEEPAAALRRLGRVPSATVQRLREISSERWWGEQPCGPSPLERPFTGTELGTVVAHYFEPPELAVVQYLPASLAVASELAMLAEDAPELARSIAPALLGQVDELEGLLLASTPLPDSGWYLQMLTATVP